MEEFNITFIIEELRAMLTEVKDDLPGFSWFFRSGWNAAINTVISRIEEKEGEA